MTPFEIASDIKSEASKLHYVAASLPPMQQAEVHTAADHIWESAKQLERADEGDEMIEVLQICAKLNGMGMLKVIGSYEDGTPHYEVTEKGLAVLADHGWAA